MKKKRKNLFRAIFLFSAHHSRENKTFAKEQGGQGKVGIQFAWLRRITRFVVPGS